MPNEIEIDAITLIALVETKPVIWNKALDTYKEKGVTRKAWDEICIELSDDFEDLDRKDQNGFVKEVMRRWGNIRDAFVRFRKKQRDARRLGDSPTNVKKYIYDDQLKFLNNVWPLNNIQSTDMEVSQDGTWEQTSEHGSSERGHTSKNPPNKLRSQKRKLNQEEPETSQELEEYPADRHLSFFKGIIPTLVNFDDDDVVQFQLGVLQLLSNIKLQKRMNQ